MTLTQAYVSTKDYSKRNENEYYPTPAIATLALLKNVDVPQYIWEPAAGRGHISKELQRNGRTVYSSDLFEYNDPYVEIDTGKNFLEVERPPSVQGLITNPPFKSNLPEKLLYRWLPRFRFVALFCRLTFMESARRYKLFTEHPPSTVLAFSERINCNEKYFEKNHGLGGMVAYAWFVWDDRNVSYTEKPKTVLEWVKPSLYIDELEKTE